MNPFSFARNTAVLWLGLVLFVVLALSFLLPIQPNDYWWYVRLGQQITAARAVPAVDTFSYTRLGQPVVYHSWLSAVMFWAAHRLGGSALTVLLRGSLLALFYALVWHACRLAGAGPRLAALLTFWAALTSSNNWAMRPQLFSYPLFALALVSLWRWRRGETGWLWLLPPVMALWVNFHGAYALGFLLAGGALVGGGGNRRALLVALGGMAAASLLNPRGWGAWQYVFTLLTDPASQQLGAEWQPPTTEVWQGTLLFGWLLLFPVLLSTCSRRPGAADWVWFLGFGWLALTGLRYVIWFVAVLAPITARVLAPRLGAWLDRAAVRGIPALNGAIFLLLLALPLALLPGLRSRWWRAAPPVLSPNTPVEATAWLARHPELPGPLWSDLAFSSYLIYALPRRPVWIDTRFELYPLEQWQQYVEIAGAGPEWPALLQGEGIGLAMIDPAVQSRLRLALERSPEWCGVYRDGGALIFARRAAQTPCLPSATVPPP